jgi:hypothetical protein
VASSAISQTNPKLLAAKLGALVRDLGVQDAPAASPGAGGAVTILDDTAYVLHAPELGVRALGPALLWATKSDVTSIILFSDDWAGPLARRALLISGSEVAVREVSEATSKPAAPEELLDPPRLDSDVLDMAETITLGGAVPVHDFGRLVGEVEGLEVVRVKSAEDSSVRLDVGVGQADRELHELVHSNLSSVEAISRAVAMVGEFRSPGAAPHPLNRIGRPRWLRSIVVGDPAVLSVGALTPVPPLRESDTVLSVDPVAAVNGSAVVVCSSGVDPDLVPEALEYRERHDPNAELVIVLTASDRLPTTDRLIASCQNTRVVEIASPWL